RHRVHRLLPIRHVSWKSVAPRTVGHSGTNNRGFGFQRQPPGAGKPRHRYYPPAPSRRRPGRPETGRICRFRAHPLTVITAVVDGEKSEQEQHGISKRTLGGKVAKARLGEWQGGPVRLGFDV